MPGPPTPQPTNPEDHAPGVSKTLEENAARSRDLRDGEREARRLREETIEQIEEEAMSQRLDL